MNQTTHKYRTLFLSALQLSTFTFGGGFVIIPLMRKKFVEKLHWIDEQEMMDYTAIAQSSPGAIAVNAAILVGYRVAGVAAVICDVVVTMGAGVLQQHRILPVLVMVGSFAASCFFGVNVVIIILVCGTIGALDTIRLERRGHRKEGA